MDTISTENINNSNVDKNECHQDFIENDAPDYESINSENDDNERKDNNSDYESDTVKNTERQEGDGQESIPPKKVDDDEDRQNPQYIPKRGAFYEHDDRTLDEDESDSSDKKERQSKKTIWIEKKEKWGHDRFNENDQAPKSKTELIGIYGYDIRNEEGPPRARRRRRYGRGPNKYTRTWEDEDAYKPPKPIKVYPKKSKPIEEFPPLQPEPQTVDKEEEEKEAPEKLETKPVEKEARVLSDTISISKQVEIQQNIDEPKTVPSVKPQQKEIKPADYRGFTKSRQYINSQFEQKILRKPGSIQVAEGLEEDLANLSISKKQNRPNNIPPRLQNEQKTSKRYSSIRQRSLPETVAATTFNQQTYYANDYTPPQPQQAILSQPPPTAVLQQLPPTIQQQLPPTIQQQIPATIQQQIPPSIQPVPVTANGLLPTPTQFAPPFAPPTSFIPAAVPPPPPFIPPPPQIINYVTTQPQFVQAPFQGFQHQQFNAVTPTAELSFQCQNGTTYYSTQNQQLGHLPLLRRPKAAIPIMPPPPQELQFQDNTSGVINPSSFGVDDNKEYHDYYENDYDDMNIAVQ